MISRSVTDQLLNDKLCPGAVKLLEDMKRLHDDRESSDVIFLTDGNEGTVHAHRLILRIRCSAFSGDHLNVVCNIPGTTKTVTSHETRIKWPGVCTRSLRDVIFYVYTGLIEILDNNVFDILSVAQDMGIEELVDECKSHITRSLNVANACVFLPAALRQSKRCAKEENDNLFLQQCTSFIDENAIDCLKSVAFLEMDKESVIHVVSSDNLSIGEEDVWRSVLRWATKKTGVSAHPHEWTDEERKKVASQLSGVIEHVRILLIDSQVFAEEVEPTGVVPIQISLDRYRFAALPDKFNDPTNDPRMKSRSHYKLFEGSKIMSGERSCLQKVLNSLFGIEKQCWKLLYQGSSNGFSAVSFHRHCDGHENTMTVVLSSKGYVCAGFADVAWSTGKTSLGKCVLSEKSFLCSLRKSISLSKRFDLKRKSFALIHHSDYGPIFGAAPDLSISDNCNAASTSISFLGHSYDAADSPNDVLMGENTFCVADYEVFELI